jgi:2-keto-4-pentenoate hydratase
MHTSGTNDAQIEAIAERFVRARLDGVSLAAFPGEIPRDLDDAYACQDAAIRRWPDVLVGWKVGYVAPGRRAESNGEERLLGPVFAHGVRDADAQHPIDFPVFVGGFAAVEAEFVFRLGTDAPRDKLQWSAEEAASLVGELRIGIETAGSPLATINALGPRVIVSDFGNNAGLLLGPTIPDWRAQTEASLVCTTYIEGREIGAGTAASIADGPLGALAFALARSARRGRALRAGDLITTGAVTGVHDIQVGESARVDFGAHGEIHCRAIDAREFARRYPA